jgi:copper chaperone NosL
MKSMARVPRVLVAVASLLLGVMYFAPVWSIRLIAPQYPEGLGLLIRLNTITGVKEHDLRSINSLNHYIGMRPIEPSAIPELKYMPWIVAGLIGVGVLTAVVGRRRLLVAWVAAFAAICVAGMYDFWRWGYDYGHNLDADEAIIVVPGMSYQPPLIGTKQLLNFQATSLPHVGAIAAGLALLLGVLALILVYRGRFRTRRAAAGAMLATVAACAAPAHAISFGFDACAECRMIVTDRRFGAQLTTPTGKSITFDSIACLRTYVDRTGAAGETWVVDASNPGTLVREAVAQIIVADSAMHPPMGMLYAVAR